MTALGPDPILNGSIPDPKPLYFLQVRFGIYPPIDILDWSDKIFIYCEKKYFTYMNNWIEVNN